MVFQLLIESDNDLTDYNMSKVATLTGVAAHTTVLVGVVEDPQVLSSILKP